MGRLPSFAQFSNVGVLEELYAKYVQDPASVESSWRLFFEGMEFSREETSNRGLRAQELIEAYRRFGHLLARVNPIARQEARAPELELKSLGFKESELGELFPTHGLLAAPEAPLRELIDALKAIYCGNIGFECIDLGNQALESWIQKRLEPRLETTASSDEQKLILEYLNRSELFEAFLHTKYVGQKRFSIEGCETLIPMLAALIDSGTADEYILGMAHRGRLNVLANLLNKPFEVIFQEFEDKFLPLQFEGSGDVKYHKGFTAKSTSYSGKEVELHLAPNSSCLESVDPVVLGLTYAKQKKHTACAVLIHGDASIAGQGVVYESLQLMRLPGYTTNGTIHIVVNNQVGFTTPPEQGRSTRYCTDIAKTFGCPVFHVNAEDPESCLFAIKLAVQIRSEFKTDVFIDLNGYRKYGHNEGDEPVYTQPLDYAIIRAKKSIRELYAEKLGQVGELSFKETLLKHFERAKGDIQALPEQRYGSEWKPLGTDTVVETAVSEDKLRQAVENYCRVPPTFHLNTKLQKWLEERKNSLNGKIDWSTAECLAFGSLLAEKVPIRLAGQDSQRGTFTQRHAVWIDQENGAAHNPFGSLCEVYNSPLSEFACLAFEFGYSWAMLDGLNVWEAQYGDFTIGAETVIDHYLTTAERKWARHSNLVLLLPHGYEGQGPEHSSARIERFLQLAAHDNIQVANPTTPAQYFHLLRRQALRPMKKPLVIFTPKSLLRAPACVSALSSFTTGSFQEVLDDTTSARRTLLCSGKVYYDLMAKKPADMAVVRIEQLYPLRLDKLRQYVRCPEIFWVQEEPENMGAWEFLQPHLQEIFGGRVKCVARERSEVTATGSHKQHVRELDKLMNEVFG